MNIVLLISIIVFVSTQNILKKEYNRKTTGGAYFFASACAFSALLFFIATTEKASFEIGLLPYAIGFGLSYLSAVVFGVLAISCGSLSLTALINSYSLIIPTLYGLIVIKEPISLFLIVGILLLVVSLFFINKKGEDKMINPKWGIYVFLSFAGNGVCSVFQRMQQIEFIGAYKGEFMIISLTLVVIITSILTLVKERTNISVSLKKGGHLAFLCGIMNGAMNLCVMILSNKIPVSVMFPSMSAGGIIMTYIISRFFYKERLGKKQFIGFVTGILSVVFLSI